MTDLPNGAVVEEFSKQVLNLHMITIDRLFEIDSDATLLYVFMTKNAVRQQTNSIWCTNTFIMKGLKWGKMRVTRAKDILEKHNFVEKITPKKNGRFEKHYIKIKYLENPKYSNQTTTSSGKEKLQPQHVPQASIPAPVSPPVVTPPVVKQPQMLNTKELNAYNKKENALDNVSNHPDYDLILKEWNKIKVTVHKEFNGNTKKLINKVIELTGIENLLEAIENYGRVFHSKEHYFNTKWNLTDFLSRGASKQGLASTDDGSPKGFWHFLGITNVMDTLRDVGEQNHDPWDTVRKEFVPLTSNYTEIFSEKTQRYYGFTKDHINSQVRWEDTEYKIFNKYHMDFSAFMELEWMIAGMLFRRKQESFNLKRCQIYMKAWNEIKSEFKAKARSWLKNDFELHG